MRRSGYQLVAGKLLALVLVAGAFLANGSAAQSNGQAPVPPSNFQPPDEGQVPTALIRSVRVIPGQDGAAIEILATRPLTPAISTVENPLRLVVDLPKSLVASRMRISYRDPQVQGVRVNQFHQDPPTVRVVIDLTREASASWDAAGNRLMIRLHPPREAAPAVPAAAVPAGAVEKDTASAASDGGSEDSGTLVLAGHRVTTGSAVSAGADTAVLHMGKGGDARICPGTTVSVTSSPNGGGVMLGMSTGSLETHYRLDASADSVLTPDFRILFAGPGEFDYAISADSWGNTCVRALPGNTSAAVVSELLGDGVYQVRPSEEVVFRSGQLAKVDSRVPEDCGCPTASVPVMRTAAGAGNESGGQEKDGAVPAAGLQPAGAPAWPTENLPAGPETASLPAESAKDVHIQVDAPFVFRAADRQAPGMAGANLPLAGRPHTDAPQVTALPPGGTSASVAQASHPGFLRKVRGFFGSIFR